MGILTNIAAISTIAMTATTSLFSAFAVAQPGGSLDWRDLEGGWLGDHTQLTSREDFVKAGEAYFSPDGKRIVFQAVPVPNDGVEPSPHYFMYVADLQRDDRGEITGLDTPRLISPEGAATTCGWFHPTDPDLLLFGCTMTPPREDRQPGYQRGTGRYQWQFPVEMEIVQVSLSTGEIEPIFEEAGYTAECSWSPDGRSILYAQVDPKKSEAMGRPDADLFIYDQELNRHTPLVVADGYDGGPFFRGDGTWICYRSDRRGDNLLQLFAAELEFGDTSDPGRVTGVKREIQLTDNQDVNWAPFWDPTGRFLIYTTSEVAHYNYEVFAIPVFDRDGVPMSRPTPIRITHASGFDGLPVFSPDARHMMWTAQRGPLADGERTASSQLWIARVSLPAIERLMDEHQADPN